MPVISPETSSSESVPAVAGTAAFGKFMRVLQLVADAKTPPTVTSLMHASGYPRPTVHRIVSALLVEGMLADGGHGTLRLGNRLIQLANQSWRGSNLREATHNALRALRDETGETVHLAVPHGGQIGAPLIYIEKLESPSAIRMASYIGSPAPLHATSCGKAYLAYLPEPQQINAMKHIQFNRFTDKTCVTMESLRAELVAIRKRGWAVDDEAHEAGVYCFGAPILNDEGLPIAAVSVSTLLFRQKPDLEASYIRPLLQACRAIRERGSL